MSDTQTIQDIRDIEDVILENPGKTQRRLQEVCEKLGDGMGAKLLKIADKLCVRLLSISIKITQELGEGLLDILHIATDAEIRKKVIAILNRGKEKSLIKVFDK